MSQKQTMVNVFMPSIGMVLVAGNENALSQGEPSCLIGLSARDFVIYNLETENSCQYIKAIYVAGIEPNASHSLSSMENSSGIEIPDRDYYRIIDKIDTLDFEGISKLIYNFESKKEICKGLKYCQIGLNRTIQMSECGNFKGGWYSCDPREYLSYGFEGFANPFIWNKRNVGISTAIELNKNMKIYVHYGVQSRAGAEANSSEYKNSRGIFEKSTPSICDMSLCYSSNNKNCPFQSVLSFQNINEGVKSTDKGMPNISTDNTTGNKKVANNWTAGFSDEDDEYGTITDRAEMALARHLTESQYTYACTGIFKTKPLKNIEISGSCSLSQFDVDNKNSTTISKWSLGCSSRSYIKRFCADSNCMSQIALNIGTPAYLSKSYKTKLTNENKEQTIKEDSIPLICELGYSFVYGGFNIPLFLSYYANVDGQNSTNFKNNGSPNVCICGIRPSRIIDCLGDASTKTFLPCLPEGGLYYGENDSEYSE